MNIKLVSITHPLPFIGTHTRVRSSSNLKISYSTQNREYNFIENQAEKKSYWKQKKNWNESMHRIHLPNVRIKHFDEQ